jgi:hypothetical protein
MDHGVDANEMVGKRTAVEWLSEQFDSIVELYPSQFERVNRAIEQAKEMEKEIIIKAYNQDLMGGLSGYRKFNDGEDYYNGTYGGNK